MRVMAIGNKIQRKMVGDVVLKFCRHHRREAFYAMQFGNHEHSQRVQNFYCKLHPLLMRDVAGLNAFHYACFEGDSDVVFRMLEQVGTLSKSLREELLAIVLEMKNLVTSVMLPVDVGGGDSALDEESWARKMEARWISPLVRCSNSKVRLRRGTLFDYGTLVVFFSGM